MRAGPAEGWARSRCGRGFLRAATQTEIHPPAPWIRTLASQDLYSSARVPFKRAWFWPSKVPRPPRARWVAHSERPPTLRNGEAADLGLGPGLVPGLAPLRADDSPCASPARFPSGGGHSGADRDRWVRPRSAPKDSTRVGRAGFGSRAPARPEISPGRRLPGATRPRQPGGPRPDRGSSRPCARAPASRAIRPPRRAPRTSRGAA